MIGKTPAEHQMRIFETALESFIDRNHELVLLAQRIDWSSVESEFSKYCCKDNGRPSFPARKMAGLMHLKNLYNLSGEGVVARWMENPYMQSFTGEKVFHTLSAHREQIGRLTGSVPQEALADKGPRGKKEVGGMEIYMPSSGAPNRTYYEKTQERKKFRRRAGIEPVIGHLKPDHRMARNFLSGTRGDAINTLLAAAA